MCRTCTILLGSVLAVLILLLLAILVNIYMLYKSNQRLLNNELHSNKSELHFTNPELFSNYRKETIVKINTDIGSSDSVDFDFLHQTDIVSKEAIKK